MIAQRTLSPLPLSGRATARWAFLSTLSLAGAILRAQAPPLPIGATDRYEAFDASGVASAPLSSGGFAVLWSVGDSPYHLDTRLQYLSPQGDFLLGGQGVAVAATDEIESAAAVAPAPGDGVFAAYLGTLSHTSEVRAYLKAFDGAGNALWAESGVLPLERPGRDVQREVQLLPDGGGGAFVCLTRDDGSSGVSREIGCQHVGAGGERLWGEAGVSAGGRSGAREQPSVVSDGRGGLLVFWINRRDLFGGSGEPLLVEGQRFSADGRALWGTGGKLLFATGLPATETGYDAALRAVPDGAGGAVLAYRGWSGRGARTDDVLAQRVSRDGKLLWRRPVALLDGPEDQILTALVPTLDGGAIAVLAASAHDDAPLRLFRLAANGRHRWPTGGVPVTASTGTAGQASARGAFDGAALHLAWIERTGGNGARRTELHSATFDARGQRVGSSETVLEALADGSQEVADLRLDAARRSCLALWNRADYRGSLGEDSVGAITAIHPH